MTQKYIPPHINGDAFNCPHCDAYAHQIWWSAIGTAKGNSIDIPKVTVAFCEKCHAYSLWLKENMIEPVASVAPMPSDDMPEDVSEDYMEARTVVAASPRAACALLRLAVQKLMIPLGEKGKKLDGDIGRLVKRGLPPGIQKALDSLRVIGNNSVHPGVLDLKDDVRTATALFDALNMTVDVMITRQKAVDELYAKLPETSKEAIQERDSAGP